MLPIWARASPKVLRMGEGKRRCTGLRSTTRSVAGGFAAGIGGNEFGYGVAFDLLKTAWIVLVAVYLYDISVEAGQFVMMKESVAGITPDRRLQVLLVAFRFGAFIELQ